MGGRHACWMPVQKLDIKDASLDSGKNCIFIPERRLIKIINTVDDIRVHRRIHVKNVARFVGQIISMSIVIGQVSQIMTSYLCMGMGIVKAPSWFSYIKLRSE
jgi:hypothetical protein